jgi:hypothetical protein
MDALSISLLVSSLARLSADMMDRQTAGTITQADIDKMLALLDHTLDTWQAKIDARRAQP